jgi:peptidase C39-like protein
MNATNNGTMPYERQSEPETARMCGAACLNMVYRSFGKGIPQSQIWPSIAKPNRAGQLASTTHLMARDALTRGFAAIAIQVRHPLQALRICRHFGIRVILNHRLKPDASTGHYSVLVDLNEKNVVLHDPYYGPAQTMPHAQLLELWEKRFSNSETAGHMLIGITAQPFSLAACQLCQTPIPSVVPCPKCARQVFLQPSVLLGCLNNACPGRMWNYICCPACDYTWTFTVKLPAAHHQSEASNPAPSPKSIEPAVPEWDLTPLFTKLDEFRNHILSFPEAAAHPEIKKQLDFLASTKETLILGLAEQAAHRKAHQEQRAEVERTARQKAETHDKKMKELKTPSPPLDGNALGQALLQSLGLHEKR